MAVKVGGVLIDILTNIAQIKKDFDQIKGYINKFSYDAKKIIKTVGYSLGVAFSVKAIKNFIVEGVKTIDTMQDMAQGAGLAAKRFQGLVQAANYAGVEARGVSTAMRSLNRNIFDANLGLGESIRYFKDIGVEFKNHDGTMRDVADVLDDVADRYAGMEDGGFKAATAAKLLGKSGSDMIPVLNQGAAGLKKITDRLERMGGVIDDDTLQRMDKVNQNIKDLGKATESVKLQVLTGMAESLERMTNVMVNNTSMPGIFKRLGEGIGFIGREALAATAGIAGFVEAWGAMLGGIAAGGSNQDLAARFDEIISKWGQIIQDLRTPVPITPEVKRGSSGNTIIGSMEEQDRIIKKLIQDGRTRNQILSEEYDNLYKIYMQLRAITSRKAGHGAKRTRSSDGQPGLCAGSHLRRHAVLRRLSHYTVH